MNFSQFLKKFKEIQEKWDQDSDIPITRLDRDSLKTIKLHNEYIRYLMSAKKFRNRFQISYNKIILEKTKYYLGRADTKIYRDKPFSDKIKNQGELDRYIQGDFDILQLKKALKEIELVIEWYESVMVQIKSRDWQIKNAIEVIKFQEGN